MSTRCSVVMLACMILIGCGKPTDSRQTTESQKTATPTEPQKQAPVSASATTQATTPQTDSQTPAVAQQKTTPANTQQTQSAEPAAAESPFDTRMKELVTLENDTDIVNAIRVCSEMQKEFRAPDQIRKLTEVRNRLAFAKKSAANLAFAIQSLSDGDAQRKQVAQQMLDDAGDLGRIYLRHALRTREEPIASEAGRLLIDMRDTQSIPLFFDKLKANPQAPIGAVSAKALSTMTKQLNTEVLSACFNIVKTDTSFVATNVVSVLENVFQTVCNSDETKFNEAVANPDGMNILRSHFEKALLSTNAATVNWVCGRIPVALPLAKGFRAIYHTNTSFSAALVDRLDTRLAIPSRGFPIPPERQTNISARWTALLRVNRPGEYEFTLSTAAYSTPQQTTRLYLNDKPLIPIENWQTVNWQPQKAKIGLSNGWHAVKVDYLKGDGDGAIQLDLAGPGAEFVSAPWPQLVASIASDITSLASTNYLKMREAEQRLTSATDLGKIFLYHTLNTDTGIKRQRAADLLASLAREIKPATIREIYKLAMADGAEPVNPYVSILCATAWRACDNNAGKFGELTGEPDAYAKLDAQIKTALLSKDPATVARACRYGYPFAPALTGLRAQYFGDPNFSQPLLERQDLQINMANRQFPLPTNRQDNISAEWTGWLSVPQAGEFTFSPAAASYLGVHIDGNLINPDRWWEQRKLTLQPGLHPFRAVFAQNQTGAESRASLTWSGPGINGTVPIPPEALRCTPWDGKLAELAKLLTVLPTTNPAQLRATQATLKDAGEVGCIYLRNAVRDAQPPVAAAAATLLADMRDKKAPPMLLERMETEKDEKALATLADALRGLVREIDPKAFPNLFKTGLADGTAEMNPKVWILCAALWHVCENNPQKFTSLVGAPDGYTKLEAHVKAAMTSKDARTVARACRYGQPIAPLLPGLRGRYFTDPDFLQLQIDRLDAKIDVANRQFPLPTNRQDNISAEWTGWLTITQDAEYTFYPAGENYAGIYIDDKIINTGNWAEARKVKLTTGLHAFRVVFVQYQPGRNSYVSLAWEGPNIPRQPLASPLRTPAWDSKLAELEKAVPDLALTNGPQSRAARTALIEAGDVGQLYLRNALALAPAKTAAPAAILLTESRDKEAPALLLARLKTERDPALIATLTDALCDSARLIDPKALPEILKLALAPEATPLNPYAAILSAVLLACNGDADTFNKLVNDPKAYPELTKHVAAALASDSTDAIYRACRYAAPLAPRQQGLTGRYYAGQDFQNLVIEAVDPQINFQNRQYRYPDKRQDDISIRWTGFLNLDKPGAYTFIVNAHNGANVWVDDQLVAQSLNGQENRKESTTLAKGLHKIRVDTWQASGSSQVQLSWIPPADKRDAIPAAVLSTHPSAQTLSQIDKALASLTAGKTSETASAMALLRDSAPASTFFLQKALRQGKPEAPIVTALVELRDATLPALLRELRKSNSSLAQKIDTVLEDLAKKPDRKQIGWFYDVLKTDQNMEFPVCARFLSKILKDSCQNNEGKFSNEFVGDKQAAANLKAYLDKLPKTTTP